MNQLTLDNSERYCVFENDDCWYGIPALSVRSIVPQPALTPAPLSDPILKGIGHIQNEFLPVVCLKALTNIQYDSGPEFEQQLLILLGPQGPWGLLIDRAESLAALEISLSKVTANDDKWSKACIGSASYQNRILQILDPQALYEYAASLIDGFWENSEAADLQLSAN